MAQNNYNWPINPTSVTSGPVQFVLDGIPVQVTEDTTDPSNSNPFPVKPIARFSQSAVIDASLANINNSTGQILTALSSYASEMEVINSTGYPLLLLIGTDVIYVSQNGLSRQPIALVSGSIIVVKTVQSATATDGIVAINLFY